MPAIPIIMAITAVAGAASAYQSGRVQKATANYQAKIAEQDASEALRAGAEEEASFRKKARAMQGSNIANLGSAGISLSGSPLLVMAETEHEIEQEAFGIRRGAAFSASRNVAQAGVYRETGKHAYKQGLMGAGGSLMQGAGSLYSMKSPSAYKGSSSVGSAGSGGASQLIGAR